jgi:membrane protease YdiL (CAAX protease family)
LRRDGFALALALVYPSVLTWIYFVAMAGDPAARGPLQIAAYVAGKIIQFGFPAVYVVLFHRSALRFNPPSARGIRFGIGFGLLVAAGMFALYYAALREQFARHEIPALVMKKLGEFNLTTPIGFFGFAAFLSIVHSLLEEYYWRWFVFLRLREYFGLPQAIAISSLGFMGHHVIVLAQYFPGTFHFLTLVVPFSLCVAVGGGVWAWLYERTRSFYAPWLSHLLIDVAVMAIAYDMVAPYLR